MAFLGCLLTVIKSRFRLAMILMFWQKANNYFVFVVTSG